MKRWIFVLCTLVLLQSAIIVKQARTIAETDAKIAAMKLEKAAVAPLPADFKLDPKHLPPGATLVSP